MDAVGVAGAVVFCEALRGLFDFGDGVEIEQLAQIGLAEKLAKLVLIDGEGLGAALRKRRRRRISSMLLLSSPRWMPASA